MTPRAHVEATLRGEAGLRPALTAASAQVQRSEVERDLRNRGLCLIDRGPALLTETHHQVEQERVLSGKEGNVLERLRVRTAAGELSSVVCRAADRGTSWTTERLFKSMHDYKPLMALFEDQRFESSFGDFTRAQEQAGGDILLRPNLGPSPLHILMHSVMGLEVFSQEWDQHKDKILTLYKSLVEAQRRRVAQAAKAPATALTYGGLLDAREIGPERFERYYLPHLREFADLMHTNGKLAGIQVHGDPRPIAEGIAATHADYVEGFQGIGLSVAEARRAWPTMALWVDVPPAAHLLAQDALTRWARQLLDMAGTGGRVLLNAGPGMPRERGAGNLSALMGVLEEREPQPAAAPVSG